MNDEFRIGQPAPPFFAGTGHHLALSAPLDEQGRIVFATVDTWDAWLHDALETLHRLPDTPERHTERAGVADSAASMAMTPSTSESVPGDLVSLGADDGRDPGPPRVGGGWRQAVRDVLDSEALLRSAEPGVA